jgi:hypothetical protein
MLTCRPKKDQCGERPASPHKQTAVFTTPTSLHSFTTTTSQKEKAKAKESDQPLSKKNESNPKRKDFKNPQTNAKVKNTPSWKAKKPTQKMAETCPIPSVSQSLTPYIHPRPTISQIRQSLHSHLERQLRLEGTQTLSLANVANPPLTQTLPDEPPASVTGVRGAYWRALRAHQVARERYEGLRAELDLPLLSTYLL